jgi:UDP-glucose 4-epimerase
MRFLVTGGSGYVGSYLCSRLLMDGHTVINYDLKDFRLPSFQQNNDRYQFCSATQRVIEDLIKVQPDFDGVFHLAAITSVTDAQKNRELTFNVNAQFTQELIATCKRYGIRNFVVASSASVYGNSNNLGFYSEESELRPINFYGESKKMMEEYIELESKEGDLNCWVLRFFNISGGDCVNKYQIRNSSLINVVVDCLKNGKEFIVNGNEFSTNDGSAVRDYVHVLDVIESYVSCMENLIAERTTGFNISNVGTAVGHSVFEVIGTMEKITGEMINYQVAKANTYEVGVSVSAEAKLVREGIWLPKYSLEDILISVLD